MIYFYVMLIGASISVTEIVEIDTDRNVNDLEQFIYNRLDDIVDKDVTIKVFAHKDKDRTERSREQTIDNWEHMQTHVKQIKYKSIDKGLVRKPFKRMK